MTRSGDRREKSSSEVDVDENRRGGLMLIQFEQKPWKLVVVGGAGGTDRGKERRVHYYVNGEERKAEKSCGNGNRAAPSPIRGQDMGKNTPKRYFLPFPLVLAF